MTTTSPLKQQPSTQLAQAECASTGHDYIQDRTAGNTHPFNISFISWSLSNRTVWSPNGSKAIAMAPNRAHDFQLPLWGILVCAARQCGITTLRSQKSTDIQKHCLRIMLRGVLGTMKVVMDHNRFLWTLFNHSPSQPITRMGLQVQHIIQHQATSTVIWLYNLLPHVSPWVKFLLRHQRITNALHIHGLQYNDHHGILNRVIYSHGRLCNCLQWNAFWIFPYNISFTNLQFTILQ